MIRKLPEPAVQSGLQQVGDEIEALEDRIHAAEIRRDNYQLQATQDPNKQSAVEGAEAEISSLQAKRGTLEHRKHLLEGRIRELKGERE